MMLYWNDYILERNNNNNDNRVIRLFQILIINHSFVILVIIYEIFLIIHVHRLITQFNAYTTTSIHKSSNYKSYLTIFFRKWTEYFIINVSNVILNNHLYYKKILYFNNLKTNK